MQRGAHARGRAERSGRPPDRAERSTPTSRVIGVTALLGVLGLLASCGTGAADHGVRPLPGAGAAPVPSTNPTLAPAPSTTSPDADPDADPAPVPGPGAPADSPADRGDEDAVDGSAPTALVAAALRRYDLALSRLAADPGAADAPGPLLQEWHAAVVVGSRLSDAMLEHVRGVPGAPPTHVVPGPDGLSYRHHVLSTRAEPGRVSFTWCGHSPGVRVRSDSGEVVDAEVGHAHGVGELRDQGAGWQLESLDQLDLAVLPPGSPDPCQGPS